MTDMPTILSIMESSGLDRKEWPCEYESIHVGELDGNGTQFDVDNWTLRGHGLTDDEAEALCAHRLRKAIRVAVRDEGARLTTYKSGEAWTARVTGARWHNLSDYVTTELAALGALLRAVKGN